MSTEELHIPVRVTRSEDSQWKAWCSCEEWGPLSSGPNPAEEALAEAHGAREPEGGCALCGKVAPVTDRGVGRQRPPWRRYLPALGPTNRWEYVCRNSAACRQRCLAVDQQALVGEPWMVLDASGSGFTVSLDDTVADVVYDLDKAIAMYRVAQDASPRDWHSITPSAGNQRALAARAVAMSALGETARAWEQYAVLCARKAGVTWDHLADLLDSSAEDLRAAHEEWYRMTDWPWQHENTPPEITEALRGDPNT